MGKKIKLVSTDAELNKSVGKHIGNMKLSSSGKGFNIVIFASSTYGTFPVSKIELLLDEFKKVGKSGIVIPIIKIINPNTIDSNLLT